MSTRWTASLAVLPYFALILASCAAERLEARDPDRGPTGAASPTTPIVRPTSLQATEQQLASTPDDAAPRAVSGHPQHEHTSPTKPLYVCPMHPEVQSPAPGECPKCGMKLVKKEPSP